MSAFSSAPLWMSSSAARKIALGGAIKIGFMRRPKYSQTTKKTATETARMALGLNRTSRKRCAHVGCGAGTDRRGGISGDEVMARS